MSHKTFCFTNGNRTRKTQNGSDQTCVYWAMGLDSTAYTLVAPAWTAKKDRMPEPQHTSRTTYRGRGGKSAKRGVSYNVQIFSLRFLPNSVYLIQSKVCQEMWHVGWANFCFVETCTLRWLETLHWYKCGIDVRPTGDLELTFPLKSTSFAKMARWYVLILWESWRSVCCCNKQLWNWARIHRWTSFSVGLAFLSNYQRYGQ